MGVKVSVIIPVYNAEKYLRDCIESLLNQTLAECEFIFINDGSVDQSGQIIESYKQKDNRIILISQENKGVSSARNKGMEAAAGEYIGFVDADDYTGEDMYETLYFAAKQWDCDAVVSNFTNEDNGQKIISTYPFLKNELLDKEYINLQIMPYLLENEDLNSACNKIFKRKLLKEKEIKFPEEMAIGEDGLFNIRFFGHANTMTYINYSGYFYRAAADSATRDLKKNDIFQRAVMIYEQQESDQCHYLFSKDMMNKFKSKKLIKSVMAYIYLYSSVMDLNFYKKYKYIHSMINHEYVRESLCHYPFESVKGRYERVLLKMMKSKLTVGLILAASYSHRKNASAGGKQ